MFHDKLCDCYQCELEWHVHELATENERLKHLQGVAIRKIRRDHATIKEMRTYERPRDPWLGLKQAMLEYYMGRYSLGLPTSSS